VHNRLKRDSQHLSTSCSHAMPLVLRILSPHCTPARTPAWLRGSSDCRTGRRPGRRTKRRRLTSPARAFAVPKIQGRGPATRGPISAGRMLLRWSVLQSWASFGRARRWSGRRPPRQLGLEVGKARGHSLQPSRDPNPAPLVSQPCQRRSQRSERNRWLIRL
jgi:hypothetical protein